MIVAFRICERVGKINRLRLLSAFHFRTITHGNHGKCCHFYSFYVSQGFIIRNQLKLIIMSKMYLILDITHYYLSANNC